MLNEGWLPDRPDATELDAWANTRTSQADLPRLVRGIIREQNDQVVRLEVRGGEGVSLRGYDGIVEARQASIQVPDGVSVWEMGTNKDIRTKANKDYQARTADPLEASPAETTFVFVTPRRWPGKQAWALEKRTEGIWKDVRALDADDLELALDTAPATRTWIAEKLEKPVRQVGTVEVWWRGFARSFSPELTEELVLAGREDAAAHLLSRLSTDSGRTLIKAPSWTDGLAFVASAMFSQAEAHAERMMERTLLVHDAQTLIELDRASVPLILIPSQAQASAQALLVHSHHVITLVTDGRANIDLLPLDHASLTRVLKAAGVDGPALTRLVQAGSKSLEALQRASSAAGAPSPQRWSEDFEDRLIRRAWLAGAWNQSRSRDLEVLEQLTGSPAVDIEERVNAVLRQSDPLFTRVGSTVAVASQPDSLDSLRDRLTAADLAAFEEAAQSVLGAVDPTLELAPSESWRSLAQASSRTCSTDLRVGLASTCALLGSRGANIRPDQLRSARDSVEDVVRNLLGRANADDSAAFWVSLEDVLALLVEAAPDVVIRAIDEGAAAASADKEPVLKALFQDSVSVSSAHTGLLWALERAAWSKQHFGLVAEALAKLAEIDPGGRLNNRPLATLQNIFRAYRPQTSVPAETRIITLDALVARHPGVAWDLLLRLIPRAFDLGMYSARPEYRDWADDVHVALHDRQASTLVDAVAQRLVRLAIEQPHRVPDLIDRFERLPAAYRSEFISALSSLHTDVIGADVALALWAAVSDYVRKHRQFQGTAWALPEEWLGPLSAAAERFQPSSKAEQHRWLFDDWTPDIGMSVPDDHDLYERHLHELRCDAVRAINEQGGLAMLRELAATVKLPHALGAAFADTEFSDDAEVLELVDSETPGFVQFALAFAQRRLGGGMASTSEWLQRFSGRPIVQARLLRLVSDLAEAWNLLPQLGPEVEDRYWAEFEPFGRGGNFPELDAAIRRLVAHCRPSTAVQALSVYAGRADIDVSTVQLALQALATSAVSESARASAHDVNSLLDLLRERGVSPDAIAALEWEFLPLLRYDADTHSLQERMASDPEFFCEVVGQAFRSTHETDGTQPTDSDLERATRAYQLLHDWRVPPATNPQGVVDQEALRLWHKRAHGLLDESGHLEVGELQLGEVFAHSRTDEDGTFPTLPVRALLEEAGSDQLERGFAIGLFNKRGVTSRALDEGGKQEVTLAEEFSNSAALIEATHPRTAAVLRSIADSYQAQGLRNDLSAKRFLEGLGL